jgi:hypothetical protein
MDGENVVTQGDEGEDFFIIVEVRLAHTICIMAGNLSRQNLRILTWALLVMGGDVGIRSG